MAAGRLPVLLIVLLGLLAVPVYLTADWWIAAPPDVQLRYVGRQSCRQCHAPQAAAFEGSHHDLAQDVATERTVLGDFNEGRLTYQGVDSRMFRRDGTFFIHTEGPDGAMADFEVTHVIGYTPLQQYMVAMPDGRWQVLRISWDTLRQEWFYHYPPDVVDERLRPDDPLHWTGRMQNWNHMCAECHATNLQKNYQLATDRFHTTFSEIDVSCEACHGPASLHVELAEALSPFWDRNHGYGLAKLKGEDNRPQIETCAFCHSRRSLVHPGFRPGAEYLDHFRPALLTEGLYYPDGQILDEVYVYGSFLQSKMHAQGVRCTDCHDPHSARLKFEGNQLCTSCHQHPPAKYDTPQHHHHPPGSTGASCVECHMPARTYMIVDPRRDHSLRVPRPDLSVKFGTPNACTGCHVEIERAVSGQQSAVSREQGSGVGARESALGYAGGSKAESGKRKAEREGTISGQQSTVNQSNIPDDQTTNHQSLITNHRLSNHQGADAPRSPDISLDTAAEIERLDRWALEHVRKWYGRKTENTEHFAAALAAARTGKPEGEKLLLDVIRRKSFPPIVRATAVAELPRYYSYDVRKALKGALDDERPLVRLAAVAAFAAIESDGAELRAQLAPRLADKVRAVRVEAARLLARERPHLDEEARQQLDLALQEYLEGQQADLDRPESHMNLGNVRAEQGDVESALSSYQTALRLDPAFVPAKLHMAVLLQQQDELAEAEELLREIVKAQSDAAEAYYWLGLVLARQHKFEPAEEALRKAQELVPENATYHFALAAYYLDLGRLEEAEQVARELIERHPDLPGPRELLNQIHAQQLPGRNGRSPGERGASAP